MKYRVYFTDDDHYNGYASFRENQFKCFNIDDFLSRRIYTFDSILETKKVFYISDVVYNNNGLWKTTIQIVED